MKRKLPNHSTKTFQTSVHLENEKLLTRILHVKPLTSIKDAPLKYPHLATNLKRKELQEGKRWCFLSLLVKCSEIERENRILLEKMSRILYSRNTTIEDAHNHSMASAQELSRIESVKRLQLRKKEIDKI
jgi:hypothetical protein